VLPSPSQPLLFNSPAPVAGDDKSSSASQGDSTAGIAVTNVTIAEPAAPSVRIITGGFGTTHEHHMPARRAARDHDALAMIDGLLDDHADEGRGPRAI
jgi:hypothetical protein